MVSWFWQWALMLLFALLIALSFTCYGVAFRGLGGPPARPLGALAGYVLRLLANPWFLLGLALAFTGSVLRLSIHQSPITNHQSPITKTLGTLGTWP